MSKTYVLLKDLPDLKAGANGVVNEFGVLCFYELKDAPEYFFPKGSYENNFEWFKLKGEKIEVEIREQGYGNLRHTNDKGHFYPYNIEVYSQPIPPEKYEAVKKAIQDVLNGNFPEWQMHSRYVYKDNGEELKYTQKQLLDMEEKAFNAAREQDFNNPNWVKLNEYTSAWDSRKYPTFSDYKNSTK